VRGVVDRQDRIDRQEVARLAKFLGVEPSPPLLQTTLDRSSAERMREMEKTQGNQWGSSQYKNRRTDIPFVRTASVGEWTKNLGMESVAKIESAWGHIMAQLGYELVTRKSPQHEESR